MIMSKKVLPQKQEEPQRKFPQPTNQPYLIAIVLMILVGIAGVAAIVALRPDADILVVGAMVFGFITPTTLSLLSFMKAQETHLSVNSRLDGFIRNAEAAARGEGREEGRLKANNRTDALAGKKKK
jgi:hypothetical protein